MLKRLLLVFCVAASMPVHWLPAAPALAQSEEASTAATEQAVLAIVVNKTNPVENISSSDLRSLLLAEQRTWSHGRRVTIVMRRPGHAERIALLKAVCRMTDRDYNRYFLRAQFTGDLQSKPKVLATAAGMRKFIFNVPGAIGYLRADEVDASVKVLRVDGHLPGETGYKLKLH